MLAEIVLTAGKDRITISEIPALFANAIHPALPADTPRQITAFKKYPLTEQNSREWCGENCQPFPVSLTTDDIAELNRSAWIGLPPLTLPINEPEWQPYRVALENKPPKDWKLKEFWMNRVLDARISWDRTAEVYLAEVKLAAKRGHLAPRSSATLLPLPGAIGELLLDCFVTLENFMSFAARFEISVRVAEVVLEPQATTASPAPAVVTASDAPAKLKNQRPDLLTPLIQKAQRDEPDPFSAAVIWPKLCDMAELKTNPFVGKTESGLKWTDANDSFKFLTKEALADRLRRAKRAR